MNAWLDTLSDGYFWALFTLAWLLLCFAVAGVFGLLARYGRGEFTHADTVDRAREQMRQELWK